MKYLSEVAKLRGTDKRLLTLKEAVQARVAGHYLDGRLYTCTALAVSQQQFKVVPLSQHLINGTEHKFDFNTEEGVLLSIDNGKYNKLLLYEEATNHSGWLAVLGGNKRLLENYSRFVFNRVQRGMAFYLPNKNGIIPLYLGDLYPGSFDEDEYDQTSPLGCDFDPYGCGRYERVERRG